MADHDGVEQVITMAWNTQGKVLRLACERLGITLLHAAPYDPEARGKMERFFRTLRGQCLGFIGKHVSLRS